MSPPQTIKSLKNVAVKISNTPVTTNRNLTRVRTFILLDLKNKKIPTTKPIADESIPIYPSIRLAPNMPPKALAILA